ncbi:MAG TPA: polyprenyl synthetase family protein, partial [Byssovorax sp.]
AALELLQSYLLMQDDWMDGDLLRRGGPSAHAALAKVHGDVKLGEASAVLASDLTWGLAVGCLSGCKAPLPRKIEALDVFLRVHRDVVFGQQLDLLGRAEDVEAMHTLKTGSYTVKGPLAIGAALAGASAETRRALDRFAAPVGVAFQLRDDLLGTFGDTAATGKPVGNDLLAGKRTAILAESDARLDRAQRRAVDAVLGKKQAPEADVREATRALEACGARAAVEARLEALISQAEGRAAALPIAAGARVLLGGAAAALRTTP